MENIIQNKLDIQRQFFISGETKNIYTRLQYLHKLKDSIIQNSDAICDALQKDLHKPAYETYMTEISVVLGEIKKHIRCLKKWTKPQKVSTPFFLFLSKSKIISEPLGLVLIIAPWNYPFQLLINPLVGAISAGNTVALKSSPYAPETSKIVSRIISQVFDEKYVSLFEGGRDVNQMLLAQKFDYIFFTGSPSLGKVVMEAASKHLTPVTLELGGKSPCIVDKNTNIKLAAKRIIWGKLVNAGQTCIAPDYLFVHKDIKKQLITHMIECIDAFYSKNPEQSTDYVRIVNDNEFYRITNLLNNENIIYGGDYNKETRYIAPTLLDGITEKSPVMQEEIFGPILPIMDFEDIDEPINYINLHNKPLALYYFGDKNTAKKIIANTSSGGVCINDTLLHISNHNLPFGGVGNSGMGRYHGKYSFETFSHKKAVLTSSTLFDIAVKYAPYKSLKTIKRLM